VSAKEFVRPFAFSSNALGSGCYSLVIKLRRTQTIRVGKLGAAVFPRGTYVYTGSAMNGLAARLRRHCTRTKKLRWHIDYLLAARDARIEKIIVYPPARGQECRQNLKISSHPGTTIILKNFGASDCSSRCASHLVYLAKPAAGHIHV
jgi:Uri superfamily endonuclease